MPKRKKSHEYCRNRFGIFNNKRRRVSTEYRCEEMAVRYVRGSGAARPALWPRRKSLDKSEAAASCPCMEERILQSSCKPVPQQDNPHDYHQYSHESRNAPWWKNVEYDSTLMREDVSTNSACNCRNLPPVSDYIANPHVASSETNDRSQKVLNLVALTSSLKLSEDNNINSPSCASGTIVSQKALTGEALVNPLRRDFSFYLPKPKLPVAAYHSLDLVFTPASSSRASTSPVGMQLSFNEPRPLVGSYHPHLRQAQWFPPPRLQVDEPFEDRSDDSDEGFCEPVLKRSHKLSDVDEAAELDEGVNVAEDLLPSPMRHRQLEYTHHSLDASLGRTCSLYWQMMSNQYGVPTKIYSMERGHIVCPFDSHAFSIPGIKIHLDCGVSMFGGLEPEEKDAFDFADSGPNMSSPNSSSQQQEGGVFAIGKLVQDLTNIQGPLGLCLQRAVQCNKSVFVFDCQDGRHALQEDGTCRWYCYCRVESRFVPCQTVPKLTQHFAGLGANELTEVGRTAIKAVFQKTFGPL